jgi:hypothetical protein
VIISPEMMLSNNFIKLVLRNREFGQRLVSVVIDEAHVVSRWGHTFRKKYSEIGIIRAFLPRGIPMVALSATLARRVRRDVVRTLGIQTDHVQLDLGNDRSNVAFAVRAMQYAANTYADLDFVIPKTVGKPSDIKSTWIFCDNISTGTEIIDHLESLLPAHLQYTGLIRPFNASMSQPYRPEVMDQFKSDSIRILVCTDAAGMVRPSRASRTEPDAQQGCNIPNVEVVVQWKLPDSLSSFVQRAGRAGRSPGTEGLAVLIVERSTYEQDLFVVSGSEPLSKGKKKPKQQIGQDGRSQKEKKEYAAAHGLQRGRRDGKTDAVVTALQPSIAHEAEDEGLRAFVQTGLCRRKLTREIYDDAATSEYDEVRGPQYTHHHSGRPSRCCDVCHPKLLDEIRPGVKPRSSRKAQVRVGEKDVGVAHAIRVWRDEVYDREMAHVAFSPDGFMADDLVDKLASVMPIASRKRLAVILQDDWVFYDTFSHSLWELILSLGHDVPASGLISAEAVEATRVHKRGPSQMDAGGGPVQSQARDPKRTRSDVEESTRQDTSGVHQAASTHASGPACGTSLVSRPPSRPTARPTPAAVPPSLWTYNSRPSHLGHSTPRAVDAACPTPTAPSGSTAPSGPTAPSVEVAPVLARTDIAHALPTRQPALDATAAARRDSSARPGAVADTKPPVSSPLALAAGYRVHAQVRTCVLFAHRDSLMPIQTSTSRRTLRSRPHQRLLPLRPSSFLADHPPSTLRLLRPPRAPRHTRQQLLSSRKILVLLRRPDGLPRCPLFIEGLGGPSLVLYIRISSHNPFPFQPQHMSTILHILPLLLTLLPLCLPPRTLLIQLGLVLMNLHTLYLNKHVAIS